MPNHSHVNSLLDKLSKDLAKRAPDEQRRVLAAGRRLVATRRALLAKPARIPR
jgi:hypothetical protein